MSDGAQDGRREPDSGLRYTQDYRSRWTHENCFNPDSVSQRTEQPASHERPTEQIVRRSAVTRRPASGGGILRKTDNR